MARKAKQPATRKAKATDPKASDRESSPGPDSSCPPWSFSSDQEHAIAAWLAKPGRDGEAGAGARAYNRAKKTACQSMLADLKKEKELQVEELEIDQLVNKVAKMVSVYKKQIDILENQTGGGVLRDEHDTAEWIWNKQGKTHSQTKETIKTYLNRVCPWFYSFDDVLGTRSSVKPPVLLEGGVSKSNSRGGGRRRRRGSDCGAKAPKRIGTCGQDE
ncbi:hypothetical protein V8E36_009645 [Tilletia maclaganii]